MGKAFGARSTGAGRNGAAVDPAQRAAFLISSGNGPGECRQAVARVWALVEAEARQAGLEIDVVEHGAEHGPGSVVVMLNGQGAHEVAARWRGTILWRCDSALRPTHRRKNWFVQVFPLQGKAGAVSIDPRDVEMQAIRAGGPGGQHQNKTASAVRAQWRHPDGRVYSVVVRDQRCQHQNRRIALTRLEALATHDLVAAEDAGRARERLLHHQLERGNPSRTFEGEMFRERT